MTLSYISTLEKSNGVITIAACSLARKGLINPWDDDIS